MKETAAGVMGVRFLAVGPSLGNEAAGLAGLEFLLALLRDKRLLNMKSLLANTKGSLPQG